METLTTLAEAGQPPGAAGSKPGRKSRRIILVACLFLAIVLAVLWYIGVFGGNVRTIQPGRAYRSATLTGLSYTGITARLTGNDLETVLKRDHIGTVICLRAGSYSDDWYRQELDACAHENVVHADVPISARSLPPPGALTHLLNIFDHARYPILMHCQAGADRTGLASTIYAHLYGNLPLDRAEAEELTWRYGHFPVDKTRAMDDFFTLYRQDNSNRNLREWITTRYPLIYARKTAATAFVR